MRYLLGTPMLKLRFSRLKSRERLLDGPFGDGGIEVAKAICLLSLELPSLEIRRKQSSLTFISKIHIDIVSLNTNRYLTPVTGSTQTRASKLNSTQYRRNQAYNDALKNSFFP